MTTNPEKAGEKQVRDGNGRWQKGVSGNPKGKAMGSRHKATLLAESLLDQEAATLTRKAIELALSGDITALKLCLERIISPRKQRAIAIDCEPIEATGSTKWISTILQKVTSGELTPHEGEGLAKLIEIYMKAVETEDIEKRLQALEEMKLK